MKTTIRMVLEATISYVFSNGGLSGSLEAVVDEYNLTFQEVKE